MKFVWLCFNAQAIHPVKNYYTVWHDAKTQTHHYDDPKPMLMDDFGTLFEVKQL
jgi:hypothetical protein